MRRARSRRAVVESGRLGAHLRQEILEVARNVLRVDDQHLWHVGHQRQRHEVFFNVVIKFGVHRRRNRMVHRAHEQRVAVGLRSGRNAGAQRAARAAPVVDDELLAGQPGKLRRQRAGKGVGAAAGRKRHDDGDRLGRPGRLGVACPGQRGHAGCGGAQDAAARAAVLEVKCHASLSFISGSGQYWVSRQIYKSWISVDTGTFPCASIARCLSRRLRSYR